MIYRFLRFEQLSTLDLQKKRFVGGTSISVATLAKKRSRAPNNSITNCAKLIKTSHINFFVGETFNKPQEVYTTLL